MQEVRFTYIYYILARIVLKSLLSYLIHMSTKANLAVGLEFVTRFRYIYRIELLY